MQSLLLIVLCFICVAVTAARGAETITIDTVEMDVEPLAADDFSDGLDRWVVEGNSQVTIREGRLLIETPDRGYATVWYREPFQGHQLIRFRARVLPPQAASNINFFFCASLPDAGDFFAQERTGAYAEYHQINNYTLTFTGRREDRDRAGNLAAPGYMRLRKNPGFMLKDENLAFKAEVETDYDIAIMKFGARIKVFVNGLPALDWWDYGDTSPEDIWMNGYAGFRTFW